MSLYEFSFIAQQSLLLQEVEEIVQELAILLKNIKADIISQEVRGFSGRENDTVIDHKLEVSVESLKKSLVFYSDFLEALIKVLWIELEEDFSNLKEIKSKIDRELKDKLNSVEVTQDLLNELGINEKITKSRLIYNIEKSFSQYLVSVIQQVALKDCKMDLNQVSPMLEVLLENIKASGLIKYEYCGLLDFAYPIKKMKSGHYCMMCISSTSSVMREFERRIKLNESIIRYFYVRVDRPFKGKSFVIDKQIEEQGLQ